MSNQIEPETFKKIVDNAYDHIVITDADGNVVYANKGVERITGYTHEEIMSAKAGKLWGGLMSKEFYKEFWDTIKVEKKPFVGEVVNRRKNGEKYAAEVKVTPVEIEGKLEYFIGIERDISSDKKNQSLKEFVLKREERVVKLKQQVEFLEKKLEKCKE